MHALNNPHYRMSTSGVALGRDVKDLFSKVKSEGMICHVSKSYCFISYR